jgi:hypothetical protein
LRLGLSCVFLRRRVAENAVGPLFVIIPPPSFHLFPSVIQAQDPVLIEAFLTEPVVDGLDIGVVRRLPAREKSKVT